MDWNGWRRLPETVEFLKQMEERFPAEWRRAGHWDRVNQLKGQQEVLEAMRDFPND